MLVFQRPELGAPSFYEDITTWSSNVILLDRYKIYVFVCISSSHQYKTVSKNCVYMYQNQIYLVCWFTLSHLNLPENNLVNTFFGLI